jgi:hypothetical protein
MADKKISALTNATTTTITDVAHVVTGMGGTPVNKKITIANLFNTIPTTIGYGTTAVGAVTVSATTQVLAAKAIFLCTGTAGAPCVATMTAGGHVGQTITIALIATAPTSFKVSPVNFLDHTGGSNTAVNFPAVGDSATLMWTGTKWLVTSLVGTAATTT